MCHYQIDWINGVVWRSRYSEWSMYETRQWRFPSLSSSLLLWEGTYSVMLMTRGYLVPILSLESTRLVESFSATKVSRACVDWLESLLTRMGPNEWHTVHSKSIEDGQMMPIQVDDTVGGRDMLRERKISASLTCHLLGSKRSTMHLVFTFKLPIACSKARRLSSSHLSKSEFEACSKLHLLTAQQISDARDRYHPDTDSMALVFSAEDRRRSDARRWDVPFWSLWYIHRSHEDSFCPDFAVIVWGSKDREKTTLAVA